MYPKQLRRKAIVAARREQRKSEDVADAERASILGLWRSGVSAIRVRARDGEHSVLKPWLYLETWRQRSVWKSRPLRIRLGLLGHALLVGGGLSGMLFAWSMPLIQGAAALEATAVGGKFMEAGTWVQNQVPTAADNCALTGTSGPVTVGATALCRSLDFTGYTSTFKHENFTVKIGDATAGAGNVALKLVSGMTYTPSAGSANWEFVSTSGTQQSINFGGKTVRQVTFEATGGNYQFAAGLTSTAGLQPKKGTVDLNGQTFSVGSFSSATSSTRNVKLDNAVISLTGTGTVWDMSNTTNMTFSATGSAITIANTSASEKKFTGGGKTFGDLTISGGSGIVVVGESANNTFGLVTINGPAHVKFGAGKTQTMTGLARNAGTEVIEVESTSSGSAAVLKDTSGTNSLDYLKVKDITAEGGAKFYAGAHSTNTSGNTGITFTAPTGPPVVLTDAASVSVAEDLHATVNPAGLATEYRFEYGTTTGYGSTTAWVALPEGSTNVAVEAHIAGLVAGQTYHYRVVAKNSAGTTNGSDETLVASGGGVLSLLV